MLEPQGQCFLDGISKERTVIIELKEPRIVLWLLVCQKGGKSLMDKMILLLLERSKVGFSIVEVERSQTVLGHLI